MQHRSIPHVVTLGSTRVMAELGRLEVPERRSDPNSNTIEVAYLRLPSRSENRSLPPVIYLAGGPGASGIELAEQASKAPRDTLGRFLKLLDAGDLILLDQRGVGLSTPRLDSTEAINLSLEHPHDREEQLEGYKRSSRLCAEKWREVGVDLAGYTTEESADDVNDLRKALGVDQVSILGGSYGSHLGLAVLRRHGAHVHRAVLSQVEGPDHTWKLPSTIHGFLELYADMAKTSPNLSGKMPDLIGLMSSVLGRLETKPAIQEVPDPINGQPVNVSFGRFDAARFTASRLQEARFIAGLPALYLEMKNQDHSRLAKSIAAYRSGWILTAMGHIMDLASGGSPGRLAQIEEEAPKFLLGDTTDFPLLHIADAWSAPDLGDAFRSSIKSDVPTLFVSGSLDPTTPAANAEEVSRGFTQSRHLIVNGMAHGSTLNVPRAWSAIVEFLVQGDTEITSAETAFDFDPLT